MKTSREKLRQWRENDLGIDIRDQWIEHIGGLGSSQWPRDLGLPRRISVSGPNDLFKKINENMGQNNIYVQVYSDLRQMSKTWDTIYIDIDAPLDWGDLDYEERWEYWEERLDEAWWETNKYVWYLEQSYNADPRVYFSGSRGFSIYVDIPEVTCPWPAVEDTIKRTLRDSEIDMDFVDMSVLEKNRISRLPYTVNWKNIDRGLDPMWCIPVDVSWSTQEIIDEALCPQRLIGVERCPDQNLLGEYISHRDHNEEFETEELDEGLSDHPARALDRVQILMDLSDHIRDGRHRILHFMLVPAMIEAGWRERSVIHEMCQEWIEATGESYPSYRGYVNDSIDRTLRGTSNGETWKAWTIETFLNEHPSLFKHFDASVTR